MSWHFSQALVEAYSEANSSAGAQSVLSSGTPMPQVFLSPDRMTEFSRLSRFGMTCAVLTDDLGRAVLTSFLADFPVRISPRLEKAQESKESGQECGSRWPESFAKWDRGTSSWKTPPSLLAEDSTEFSGIWPRWGMMRGGECSEQSMPGRPIRETAFGLWPTPTVCGNYNRKGLSATSGDGLATAVKMWLTPQANEDACGTPAGKMQKMLGNDPRIRGTTPEEWGRGTLNPTWVEWLMGWPLGYTDLKPLETDKFPQWRHSHGGF
jgi:hypothetical protein